MFEPDTRQELMMVEDVYLKNGLLKESWNRYWLGFTRLRDTFGKGVTPDTNFGEFRSIQTGQVVSSRKGTWFWKPGEPNNLRLYEVITRVVGKKKIYYRTIRRPEDCVEGILGKGLNDSPCYSFYENVPRCN